MFYSFTVLVRYTVTLLTWYIPAFLYSTVHSVQKTFSLNKRISVIELAINNLKKFMQFWCAILTVIFYTLILKALLEIFSCTLYIHTCLEYGVHVSTGVFSHVRFGVSVHSSLSYTYIDNQYIWEFVYNYVVWISLALRIWFYNCFRH